MSAAYGRRLYVMCGLPFSGKSTLARALAAFCGCELVVYDAINTNRGLGLDGALIPQHEWERTEAEALRRIEAALTAGRSVIYDHANFLRRQRELLGALATRHRVPMQVIWVDVSAELATARWRRNRETGLRYDVRDEDFMHVLSSFEAPAPEEAPLRYDGVTPPHPWLNLHIASHK